MMGEGGRDKGVEVKHLLVITDRLRGGGGGKFTSPRFSA